MASEKRLIDAHEAKAKLRSIRDYFGGPPQTEQDKLAQAVVKLCIEEVDKLRPVDAAEVVRCEKCRYYEKAEYDDGYKMVCRLLKRQTTHNDFCSSGERRTDNG